VETPFPDLADERAHLAYSRKCRDRMIERLERLDPEAGASDEITIEYIAATVGDALIDLRQPGAGDFFGRIDEDGTNRWYIGRRHIETPDHDPVVVDWRAPVAAPFYRATSEDRFGVSLRRRFTLTDGDITAYLDERLDDPDAAPVAGGIPDPVLAEIGAARTGAMREIVATIQGEQDRIIRLPLDTCLAVQGGPGTGKTAVGLHRVAYLLFEHRHRLAREGVLVVGPNRIFLEYIGDVLPSLGERSVRQTTLLDLAVPKVPITATDSDWDAEFKGSDEMAKALVDAARARVVPPQDDVRCPLGARTVVVAAADIARWLDAALDGTAPFNRRRESFRSLVARQMDERTGVDGALSRMPALRSVIDRAWPVLKPVTLAQEVLRDLGLMRREARKVAWTAADQVIVDEAHGLLERPLATYGFVVVDEAQDLTAMALRMIARRAPGGQITLLGDLAQATAPGAQRSWTDTFEQLGCDGSVEPLTIGYRVPGPILEVANQLLPRLDADVAASRAARVDGSPPAVVVTDRGRLAGALASALVDLKRRHRLTGAIVPIELVEPVAAALTDHGLVAADHLQRLGNHEVPILPYHLAKGLELDGVAIAAPELLLDGGARSARLLYIALTRAVQELTIVTADPRRLQSAGLLREWAA
jgi:DNA helicase IV